MAEGAGVVVVRNVTRGTNLAYAAQIASTPWSRLLGLIGYRDLLDGTGLILPGTPWIHTAFMAFPIDVLFYTQSGYALLALEAMPPWRLSPICWRAHGAIELPAGRLRQSGTRSGDRLHIEPRDVR